MSMYVVFGFHARDACRSTPVGFPWEVWYPSIPCTHGRARANVRGGLLLLLSYRFHKIVAPKKIEAELLRADHSPIREDPKILKRQGIQLSA